MNNPISFLVLLWPLSAAFARLLTQVLLKFTALNFSGTQFALLSAGLTGALALILLRAFLWQKSLEHLPLTFAHSLSSIVLPFTILSGHYLFEETIGTPHLIGIFLVLIGLYLITAQETGGKE